MALASALVLVAAAFLVYAIVGACVNYRRLRQFGGPFLAGCSRAWLFWQSCRARVHEAQFDAIKENGSVARIGPNLLVTNDADIVRHLNAPGSRWRRSEWYNGVKLDPRQDTVFSTRDEHVHATLRSKESGAYNGRDIDTLEPTIDERVVELIELIRREYRGRDMDLAAVVRFFTLDVLSSVAFGRPFGFMAANKDLWKYDEKTSQFTLVLEWAVNHRFFRAILQSSLMQHLTAPKETDRVGMGPLLAIARGSVAERYVQAGQKQPKVVKNDMLGHFVSHGLTQLQSEAEAFLQIIAGSDSTSTVLRITLFLLIGTPVAYNILRAEVDAAAADVSYPVISYNEAQRLPFLSACLWEGLRMYPPLFGLKSKVAPPGGDTIKGYYFPAGTEVATCDSALCRNPEIFGEDAHLFRPERWINTSPETRIRYKRTVDTVFGSGRFLCLGRHIAMMELHKALYELMRNFEWAIVDPLKGINSHAHNVHIQSNMNIVATLR
ncbi:cytochrome P450 [Piedraia hortae CBS 480.64]|uniref:Cytochrome P450 n=1 Tax=Piedraia hortae CBS 480.64 TaxID=1314780 RepID=A0A6A7BUV6_9PEZI|nr:cytochrome P450 [Piedraia hortae CBS 480.64]